MDKTCLQAGDLGNGKIEWLNRDGKGGFEELWRERESNDGFGGGGVGVVSGCLLRICWQKKQVINFPAELKV